MSLSTDLIDQFVQATNDEKKEASDGIAYGTVVKDGDATYVQLDGSTYSTPVTSTTNVKHGERVAVLIKNHTATITGNFSSPADSTTSTISSINSFDIAVGKKISVEELTANSAFIEFLLSDKIVAETIVAADAKISELDVDKLTVDDLKAIYGNFDALDAYFAKLGVTEIDKATIKDLNATCGHFRDLHVDYGEFEKVVATKAKVGDLVADTIDAEIINGTALDVKYANIEFGNIGEAAIRKLFAGTGLIDNLTVGDGLKVTGDLVAVNLNADNIKSGTMTADRLLLKDSTSGLYYQLNLNALGETFVTDLTEKEQQELQNGIHGSNIIANSITAKHIVSEDLTAFGATIANFKIVPEDDNVPGRFYSDVKEDVNNDTRGVYMDTSGQFAVGDSNNFVKFYKDADGKYKLAINASQIILGSSGKNVEDALDEAAGGIESITKQYYLSTSKDVPTNDAIRRNYNITVIQNDDGTQTLSITDDAIDDGGDYDIVVIENADGTQTLSIADAVGNGGDYDIAVIQNDDGTKTLLVADDVGWSEIPPTWQTGMYMWTRDKIVYKNPTRIEYTTPVLDSAWEAVNELETDSREYAYDKVSEVNDKLNNDKLTLEGMINKNALDVLSLSSLVQSINGKLQRIVTDEDEANATMFEQNGESYIFNFFEKLKSAEEALAEYVGHVSFEYDEIKRTPYILIKAADDSNVKLRLDKDSMMFLDSGDESIGLLKADNEGRLGIAVDNETVTGEFRQSNQNEEHGEFVWQVRRNGNYGLSWKGSVKT